jgi:hypothetical protein
VTSDERARQIGLNEALFRQVNERIDELQNSFGSGTLTMQAVCECGDPTCTAQLEIEIELYRRVRSDARLFLIRRGHQMEDVEDVVESHGETEVVRKHPGLPSAVAEITR